MDCELYKGLKVSLLLGSSQETWDGLTGLE